MPELLFVRIFSNRETERGLSALKSGCDWRARQVSAWVKVCGGVAVARERRYILSNEAEDGLERGVFEERACERVEKKGVNELCGLEPFFKACAQMFCDLRA